MLPVDRIDSMFRFVIAAAKRMRQLQAGARPLQETHSRKAIKIAVEELLSGALKFEMPEAAVEPAEKEKKKKSAK